MPNLDFYAVGSDYAAVMDAVFDSERFRVFEAYSEPGHQLRELNRTSELPASPHGTLLELYPIKAGPEPIMRRITLKSRGGNPASFRYVCRGWGLVQLQFGAVIRGQLRLSHTNHNTPKRAMRWADTYPELGDPEAWDFPAVARSSSRLNRRIRALAVNQVGSHPILPEAALLFSAISLRDDEMH